MSADYNVRSLIKADREPITGVTTTADGVTLADGDKVLIVENANPVDNRVYTYVSATQNFTPTASISYVPGFEVRVLEGLDYMLDMWIISEPGTITPGTTNMRWLPSANVPEWFPINGIEAVSYFLQLISRPGVSGDHDVGPLSLSLTDRGIVDSIAGGYGQETYVEGLLPSYLSTTQFTVGAGAAWSDGAGRNADYISDTTVSVSGATASALYYIYSDTASGDVLVGDPTAPDTPYAGSARNMTGNTYRRYVGAMRLNASSQPYRFIAEPFGRGSLFVSYLEDATVSPFRVVSGGAATTNQTVNLGPSGLKLVPPTCRMIYGRVGVNATAGVWIDNSEMSTSPATQTGVRVVTPSERAQHFWIPLDANQSFRWANTAAGGSTNIDVQHYVDRR